MLEEVYDMTKERIAGVIFITLVTTFNCHKASVGTTWELSLFHASLLSQGVFKPAA